MNTHNKPLTTSCAACDAGVPRKTLGGVKTPPVFLSGITIFVTSQPQKLGEALLAAKQADHVFVVGKRDIEPMVNAVDHASKIAVVTTPAKGYRGAGEPGIANILGPTMLMCQAEMIVWLRDDSTQVTLLKSRYLTTPETGDLDDIMTRVKAANDRAQRGHDLGEEEAKVVMELAEGHFSHGGGWESLKRVLPRRTDRLAVAAIARRRPSWPFAKVPARNSDDARPNIAL